MNNPFIIRRAHLMKQDNLDSNIEFDNMNNKQFNAYRIVPIYKTPKIDNKFFLFGDYLISLNDLNKESFGEIVAVSNQYRPVANVRREVDINYIRINLDYTQQGLQDFNFIIHILQSMQDASFYQLSQILLQYQGLVNDHIKQVAYQSFDDQQIKKQLLQQYRDQLLPEILKQEVSQNPDAIQVYYLLDSKNGLVDLRTAEYGMNYNFLNLIGTDFNIMQEFILRVGWFDASWFTSTQDLIWFLEKYIEYIKLKKMFPFQNQSFPLLTLDKISLQSKVSTKIFYLLNNSNLQYTQDLKQDQEDSVIGVIVFLNFDVDVKDIKMLIKQRQSKKTLQNNHLLEQLYDCTLSQFEYSTQSDFFYQKFYLNQHVQCIQKPIPIQEIYPEKTCKFKFI